MSAAQDANHYITKLLPYGLIVTRACLLSQGVSRSTVDSWVRHGKLVSLLPGVFTREMPGKFTWQALVCSLQHMQAHAGIYPGGLSVLQQQGFARLMPLSERAVVHLYGPDKLPVWAERFAVKYLPGMTILWHGRGGLGDGLLSEPAYKVVSGKIRGDAFSSIKWGADERPLILSTLERAAFEMLVDVPDRLSFERVDQIFQGLVTLSPRRIEKLLAACDSVKLKRLFLWLAERHKHQWLGQLDLSKYTLKSGALGAGKRVLVKGGRLDPKYLITVPAGLHGQS